MATEPKSISASAEKLSDNDIKITATQAKSGVRKWISNFPEMNIYLKVLDQETGKHQTHNTELNPRQVKEYKLVRFTKVSGRKNKDGRIDPSTAFSFFIADPDKMGGTGPYSDYTQMVKILDDMCKNPANRLFTEDDHFKWRNPEAYKVAKEKQSLEKKMSEKDERIAFLEEQLALKKKKE
jgi:hypothetical protein